MVKKGSRSSGKLGEPHELEGQENLLKKLELEKVEQAHSFHKCLLITTYVPGPQANNPPENKADNILCLLESSITLDATYYQCNYHHCHRNELEKEMGRTGRQGKIPGGNFLKYPKQVIWLPMKTHP